MNLERWQSMKRNVLNPLSFVCRGDRAMEQPMPRKQQPTQEAVKAAMAQILREQLERQYFPPLGSLENAPRLPNLKPCRKLSDSELAKLARTFSRYRQAKAFPA